MFFKRIELYGFKSFAQKTAIDFMPGATIIVGPNGCGKSNILDAVRWVLGEQSARAIRGQRMGDLIFNGSSSVRQMNVARVALTLDNEDGVLDLDANEIQIGRQLFRTGESQYLINRMACRARSIQDLLMNTGVGVNAYSILEQGRVDMIVTAKPLERRVIFEEAAGVSRYRQRKAEAARKLERAEADLARLDDIIREVKGQSISLKRQANRALRFKRLEAELTLEMALLAISYQDESSKRDAAQECFDRVRGLWDTLTSEIDALEGSLDEERERLGALEDERDALLNELNQEREAIGESERVVSLLDERRANYQRQSQELAAEVKEANKQAGRIEEEEREVSARRQGLEQEVERLSQARDERLEAQQALRREHEGKRGELRDGQRRLEDSRERQRRRENEVRLWASRSEAIEAQIQKARASLAASAEQRRDLEERLEERAGEIERIEALIAERRGRLEQQLKDRAQAEETLGALLGDLESTLRAHSESASRLAALRELEQRYEGYGNGVREVMRAAEANRFSGILGILGRLIRSDSEYETAIEMALGSSIQDIVTSRAEDAVQVIEYLREGERGRASFLPIDLAPSPRRDKRLKETIRRAGVIGVAARLVECDDWLRPVVEATLGSTILVEDLDVALGLCQEGFRTRYVSLSGEVLSPHGSIAGGHLLPLGLLGREREIDELTEQVGELKKLEDQARETAYSHRETLRLDAETLNEMREEVHVHEVVCARARNEQEGLTQALDDVTRRLDEQEEAVRELNEELARAREHIEKTEAEAKQLAGEGGELAKDIERRLGEVEGFDEALASASEALNEASVELTSARERRASLRDRAVTLTADCERARRTAEQKSAQINTLKAQSKNAAREQKESRAELAAMIEKRDETQRRLTQRSDLHEKRMRALDDVRQKLQEQMRDRNEAQNRVHESDLELQQANLKLESLNEQAREKFRKTAEEVAEQVEALREKLAARERARLEEEQEAGAGLKDERPERRAPQAGERTEAARDAESEADEPRPDEEELLFELPDDANELRARIGPLREQIARLGPINTVAIEEYDQLRERYLFLQNQQEDMIEARESLDKTIRKIDRTSRELFKDAFEKINENFQEMFRRLFKGGKAYLELDPEVDDILEAGVDIIAQPPGKQLLSLRLMSGGEKAYTAVALMFAIFQFRPTPFCILDEIDAPLDDPNVLRLLEVLREFSKTVQFIIITHNKITMQLADTIYGVTMDEPGVSRVLSIPRHLLKDPEDLSEHAGQKVTETGSGNGAGDSAEEAAITTTAVN